MLSLLNLSVSLNTARGALSSLGIKIEDYAIGKHPLVIRFLRGVYNLQPTVHYLQITNEAIGFL
jgi:hypothetical protein